MKHRRPLATYRLQLNKDFRLDQATELVPYFKELGISHLYASPITTARPGSVHGYDVVDHEQVNPELGGEAAMAALAGRLDETGLGLVVDVVPNHMCIAGSANRWWLDVLENGPSSPHAEFFDIDWHPPKGDLEHKVLLPVLGEQYGRILENGEIRLSFDAGAFYAEYYELKLPIAPRSTQLILARALEEAKRRLPGEHPDLLELESIMTSTRNLPARSETDPERIRERFREKEIIKRRLATLCEASEEVRGAFTRTLALMNGTQGEPRSFDALEELLAEQAYRLSYWRVASDEINYRRFFDINELAAIRVEEPTVFQAVHGLIFDLVKRGWIHGVRVDHVDGLYDPERYLADLQKGLRAARGGDDPFYVVVEKILGHDENMPTNWACAGTTGYDFLNHATGVLFDGGNADAFRRLYERFTGGTTAVDDLFYASKKLVLDVAMSSELTVLARILDQISEQHRHSRDFTLNSLHAALRELIACFPVYRSYLCLHNPTGNAEDRKHVAAAVRCAKRRNPAISASIYDFIAGVLLGDDPPGLSDDERRLRRHFALRVQQLTGPVTAKGIEDTSFYRHYPVASLAEVGGDPAIPGLTVAQFHKRNLERRERWPLTMNASSTHDTKRSEDVRARINVLSELPGAWYRAIVRWADLNQDLRPVIDGTAVPDRNEEYLLYQTLVGVWPLDKPDDKLVGRVEEYMIKALREAKVHSSWVNVNEPYEQAVRQFVRAILAPQARFLRPFLKFQQRIARAGALASLSALVLKLASPGVPDFYQGTEMWDLSLVDPDNRRPVDWRRRRAALETITPRDGEDLAATAARLVAKWQDGAIKLHVTRRGLLFRASAPEVFLDGSYRPLEAAGDRAGNVVAFAREQGDRAAVAVVGRHFAAMDFPAAGAPWRGTTVALPGDWKLRDTLTGRTFAGGTLDLEAVFATLPVALLERIA